MAPELVSNLLFLVVPLHYTMKFFICEIDVKDNLNIDMKAAVSVSTSLGKTCERDTLSGTLEG